MKLFNILLFTLFVNVLSAYSQSKITICGNVTDRDTKSPLPGATITVSGNKNVGCITDENGKFCIKLSTYDVMLVCNFIGYAADSVKLSSENRSVNFQLLQVAADVGEVKIVEKGYNHQKQPLTGVETMNVEMVDRIPSLMGEKDPIKALAYLPGVQTAGDGASGFQVRGSTANNNLVLLDDAIVNNAGHFLGFFSTFNNDILRDVTLYKGVKPAQYGERSASVLQLQTKDGDVEKYHFSAGIGILASSLTADGPIVKNKTSFLLSARRSYFDLFLKLTEKYRDMKMFFNDVNLKIVHKFNNNNTLRFSAYSGRDYADIVKIMSAGWKNRALDLRHTSFLKNGAYLNSSFCISDYVYDEDLSIASFSEGYKTGIRQYTWKENYNQNLGKHSLNIGLQASYHDVITGEWYYQDDKSSEKRQAEEYAVYVNDNWTISEKINANIGIRATRFDAPASDVNQNDKSYYDFEPRVALNVNINEHNTLKIGVSQNLQNIHAVIDDGIASIGSRFSTSTSTLKPELSRQVDFGFFSTQNGFDFSAEVYYKHMKNVPDYRDGCDNVTDIRLENLLLAGRGRSYGLELCVKKNVGKLTGLISYTLSKTETKIDGINQNRWYRASNDRRHDVSFVAMYDLNNKWQVSAAWIYYSGHPITLPSAKYAYENNTGFYFSGRNEYRMPDYHRLDLGVTMKMNNFWKLTENNLAFGLFNAYCHYNPILISIESDVNRPSGTKTVQYALFGIVPYITWNVKF